MGADLCGDRRPSCLVGVDLASQSESCKFSSPHRAESLILIEYWLQLVPIMQKFVRFRGISVIYDEKLNSNLAATPQYSHQPQWTQKHQPQNRP